MKKILIMLLVCILCTSAVACNRGDEENNWLNPKNAVATLKIGYNTCGYGDEYWEIWCEEYNKAHPNEQISFELDNAVGPIQSCLQTGADLCDIYFSLAQIWQAFARNGWLEPLDDLYTMTNEDGKVYADALVGDYEKFGIVNGHHYVVPHSGPTGNGFVYSKKFFDENNLTIPTTVSELYELVDEINALTCNNDNVASNDVVPFAWGGQVITYWDSFIYSLWAGVEGPEKIQEFYKAESPEIYKDRPGVKYALEVFRKLVCSGEGEPKNSLLGAMSKNHLLSQNDFVQGKAAMLISVGGFINETATIISEDFDPHVFAFPHADEAITDENGNPLRYSVISNEFFDFLCVPSAIPDENKVYAKKFLLWLSTEGMCKVMTKYANGMAPFEYNPLEIEGLHPVNHDMIEIAMETEYILGISDSLLNEMWKIKVFPSGSPYQSMILENKRPSTFIEADYLYAKQQWTNWIESVS